MTINWKYTSILAIIFLARLGFAALVYARPELALANDSDRYVPIANNILNGTAYAWNTERPGELLNTVGYPLFLAGVFSALGRENGDIALSQLLITGLMALATYFALRRYIGAPAGFGAALVLLWDPLTILWSMTVLTESLFAVAVGSTALLLAAWARGRASWQLIAAGVLGGIACLVRPVGMVLVAAWGAAVALADRRRAAGTGSSTWSAVRTAVLFILPAVLLVIPWFVRNALLWDCATLSSVDRVTMRDYVAAKIMVETEHIGLEEAQERLQADDPGMCPRDSARYREMVLENPVPYLRLHLAGTVPVLISTNFDRWLQYFGNSYELPDLWRPYMDGGARGLLEVLGHELWTFPQGIGVMAGLSLAQLAIYVLAALGARAVFRFGSEDERWYAGALLVGLLVLIITPGQSGHERFRVPMQPVLAILIGFWLAHRRMRLPRVASPHSESAN